MLRVGRLGALVLAGLMVASLASCSGAHQNASRPASPSVGSRPGAPEPRVTLVGFTTSLGRLVGLDNGLFVYVNVAERRNRPSCFGACTDEWRPVVSEGTPMARGGADPRLVGTVQRGQGLLQVTYAGHPLYFYAGQTRSLEVNGQGVGGTWFVISVSGRPVR